MKEQGNIKKSTVSELNVEDSGRPYSFEVNITDPSIKPEDSRIILAAENNAEMIKWIETIRQCVSTQEGARRRKSMLDSTSVVPNSVKRRSSYHVSVDNPANGIAEAFADKPEDSTIDKAIDSIAEKTMDNAAVERIEEPAKHFVELPTEKPLEKVSEMKVVEKVLENSSHPIKVMSAEKPLNTENSAPPPVEEKRKPSLLATKLFDSVPDFEDDTPVIMSASAPSNENLVKLEARRPSGLTHTSTIDMNKKDSIPKKDPSMNSVQSAPLYPRKRPDEIKSAISTANNSLAPSTAPSPAENLNSETDDNGSTPIPDSSPKDSLPSKRVSKVPKNFKNLLNSNGLQERKDQIKAEEESRLAAPVKAVVVQEIAAVVAPPEVKKVAVKKFIVNKEDIINKPTEIERQGYLLKFDGSHKDSEEDNWINQYVSLAINTAIFTHFAEIGG